MTASGSGGATATTGARRHAPSVDCDETNTSQTTHAPPPPPQVGYALSDLTMTSNYGNNDNDICAADVMVYELPKCSAIDVQFVVRRWATIEPALASQFPLTPLIRVTSHEAHNP